MQIVCPACHAVYEVPDAALAAAPRVKCAKCKQEWAPLAKVAPAAPQDAPAQTVAGARPSPSGVP